MRYHFRLGLALLTNGLLLSTARADEPDIRKAVTFYASFDEAVKGDFGGGDLNAGTRFPHPTEKGQFVFEKGDRRNRSEGREGEGCRRRGIRGDRCRTEERLDVLPDEGKPGV